MSDNVVEITKKRRYTKEVIEGLLDNRAFHDDLKYSDTCTDVVPFLDFDIAAKKVVLYGIEQQIFDIKYSKDRFYTGTNETLALELGVSPQYVGQTIRVIVDKFEREMNRGVKDV